jgi:hypothetical protein
MKPERSKIENSARQRQKARRDEPRSVWPDEFRACLGAWHEEIPRPDQPHELNPDAIVPSLTARRPSRTRLARESARLNPQDEKCLADEDMGDVLESWPKY